MLLEITANILLPQNGPTWSQLRHGDLSAIDFGGASLPLVHLIQGMLVPDPTQRPTAKDILCHPLVQPLVVQ